MGFISEQIEKMYKNVLFERQDPDGSIFYFDYSDFDGLHKQEYTFTTKKGHKLHGGFYCYDDPDPNKLIVFDHGLGTGHRAYMREIETLCRHGYLVYSFDHTGSGRSEGEHVDGLLGSLADMDDCLDMIKKIPGISEREISLVGHSRGGFSSLNVIAYHPEVKSVVAISAFLSLNSMLKQLVPSVIFPFRRKIFELEKRHNRKYADASAIKTLEKTTTPVLLIHSLDDEVVKAKYNILSLRKQLFDRDNLDFMLLNGKGHSPHYTTEAAIYKREFFRHHGLLKKKGLLEVEEQKAMLLELYDWYSMTDQDDDVWEKIFKFLDK